MNEETVELLFPYLDVEGFTPEVAKKASGAVAGGKKRPLSATCTRCVRVT